MSSDCGFVYLFMHPRCLHRSCNCGRHISRYVYLVQELCTAHIVPRMRSCLKPVVVSSSWREYRGLGTVTPCLCSLLLYQADLEGRSLLGQTCRHVWVAPLRRLLSHTSLFKHGDVLEDAHRRLERKTAIIGMGGLFCAYLCALRQTHAHQTR